jgi:hypothetical protein
MISKARNSTFELIFTHNKNSTTFTFLESTIKKFYKKIIQTVKKQFIQKISTSGVFKQ